MNKVYFIISMMIISMSALLFAQPVATLLQTSYNAEANSNYQLAIESMKTVEKDNDSDPFFKLRLGWLYYSSGQYQSALDYYTKTTGLSNCLEAKEGVVNSAYMLGKWDKVIATGNQILAKYPDHYYALTKTAYSYYAMKDYVAAANLYNKLLTTYQYNLELRGYYLSCQVLLGDLVNAKRTFLQLQQYSPNNPFILEYAKKFR
jgi:tetratricopeptide (TPR) repeat protein